MAKETKEMTKEERTKVWLQNKMAHKPKNRSSKHLRWINHKPITRCVNREILQKWSDMGDFDATQELIRRDKHADRNALRKARYVEKVERKRLGVKK